MFSATHRSNSGAASRIDCRSNSSNSGSRTRLGIRDAYEGQGSEKVLLKKRRKLRSSGRDPLELSRAPFHAMDSKSELSSSDVISTSLLLVARHRGIERFHSHLSPPFGREY